MFQNPQWRPRTLLSRRSLQLVLITWVEFRGPSTPIDAPTQYDLISSLDEGQKEQRLEETSNVPQIESNAETPAMTKAKTMHEPKDRLSKRVNTPAQKAALPTLDRIRLARRIMNLICGMRMYGENYKDIRDLVVENGFINEE